MCGVEKGGTGELICRAEIGAPDVESKCTDSRRGAGWRGELGGGTDTRTHPPTTDAVCKAGDRRGPPRGSGDSPQRPAATSVGRTSGKGGMRVHVWLISLCWAAEMSTTPQGN